MNKVYIVAVSREDTEVLPVYAAGKDEKDAIDTTLQFLFSDAYYEEKTIPLADLFSLWDLQFRVREIKGLTWEFFTKARIEDEDTFKYAFVNEEESELDIEFRSGGSLYELRIVPIQE